MREGYKFIIILVSFLVISGLNYIFYSTYYSYIFRYSLLPVIILSSYFYGAGGGVLSGAVSFFIYLPLIFKESIGDNWEGIIEIIASLILFSTLGIFSGVLFEREKNSKNYYYLLSNFTKKLSARQNIDDLMDEFCKMLYSTFNLERTFSKSHLLKKVKDASNINIFIEDNFFHKFTILLSLSPEMYLILENKKNQTDWSDWEIKLLREVVQQFALKREVLHLQHKVDSYIYYIEGLLLHLPLGIVIYQRDNLLYANEVYEKMLNENLLSGEVYEELKKKIDQKDGLQYFEIKGGNGQTVGVNIHRWEGDKFIITFKDISLKRKVFLHSISEKQKADLVSIFSHEIRTPLTSIKGFISTLQEDKDNYFKEEEKVYFYHIIKEETYRLSRLLGDLLDLSEMEENKALQIIPEKVNIIDIVNKVISLIKLTTEVHNFKVVSSDVNQYIFGDKDRIRQILFNLIINAVKYSPAGKNIFVVLEKENNFAKISVIDEGEGIEEEKIPQLFIRGKQFQEKITGLGLGLYLTKNLVERQGGKIWVESIKNFGSAFTFTLPLH